MPATNAPGLVEHVSTFSFDETVKRLSSAICGAGMQIFAIVDHAANAKSAGLSMPPTVVLIYGKAEGGTPIMLVSPRSALDLPLRVLVQQDTDDRTTIAFHPIKALLEASGVPAEIAGRLEPAQTLLPRAIETGAA